MLAAAAFLALQACGKEDIDLTGKACPCPTADYECDSLCQVCVPAGTTPGSSCSGATGGTGAGGSGGLAGAGAGGTGGTSCTPAITFQNFKAVWATPESIRWEWEPLSPVSAKDQFKTYELEVTAPGESPRTYDGTTNPELGVYVQPNSGVDFTMATASSGLTPGKLYTGVLRAIDTQDCAFTSPSASAPRTTQPKGGAFELYADTQPPGSFPLDATEVTAGCKAGNCLQSLDCVGSCFFNLRWSGTTLNAPISEGEFSDAYVEFYVKSNSAAPLWWSESWLQVGTGTGTRWRFHPFSIPADDQFHKIQIPLRQYFKAGAQLDYAAFSAQPLKEVMFVGASPTDGTFIWVDDAYIRW